MSTKIYNAYKIDAPSLDEAYLKLEKLRKKVEPMAEKLFINEVVEQVFEKWCRKTWYNPYLKMPDNVDGQDTDSKKDNRAGYLFLKVLSKINKKATDEPHARSSSDVGCEASIMPYKNQIYCVFFAENSSILKYIAKRNWLQDFSYWDNTDPDENLNKKDWQNRKTTWKNIFKNSNSFKDIGMTFKISSNFETKYITLDKIKEYGFNISEEKKNRARQDFFVDILYQECLKHEEFKVFANKHQIPAIMRVSDVVRGKTEFHLYEEIVTIVKDSWVKVQEEYKEIQYNFPTFQDLFMNEEEVQSTKEKNILLYQEKQTKVFKPPKL